MEEERKLSPEPTKRRNASCSPPPQKKMSLCSSHTAAVNPSTASIPPTPSERLSEGSGTSNGTCQSEKLTALNHNGASHVSQSTRLLSPPVNGSSESTSTTTVNPSSKGTTSAAICPTSKIPTASAAINPTAKNQPTQINPKSKSIATNIKPTATASVSSKSGTAAISPVATKCSHHSTPEKFEAREDLVKQIMDMGICRNGAVKALYWTGNKSALAASNWIFDQPERDLDTPLEDELEMIRAQQLEREREEIEREKAYSRIVRRVHHNHIHHHLHEDHMLDEEYLEDLHDHEDLDDEEDDDEDEDEDEEDDEDELDMDFKMVFVINRSLEISPGQMTMGVSKSTAGLFRKIYSQAQSAAVGPDELAMWGDFGERTVILWADTEQHIKDLELMAKSLRLPCHMVESYAELKGQPEGGASNSRGASMDYRHCEGGKAMYKSVLGLFGEERELNKVTGRLKVVP